MATNLKLYCDQACGRIATTRIDGRWLCPEHAKVSHLLGPSFHPIRALEPTNGGKK